MELCGTYCLDPTEEEGFAKRAEPVTSKNRLEAFLGENKGAHGRRSAQTALKYVEDNSASPMESAVYLALCLPYMRGGYCLPRPLLNYTIDLNDNAKRLSGLRFCRGDLCWKDDSLVLEYLGESSHEGGSNMLADRRRTLAIEEMGYDVVEITKEQALDVVSFDILARRIAVKLGKRLQTKYLGATDERMSLFDAVYAWRNAAKPQVEAVTSREDEPDAHMGRIFGLGASRSA